MGLRHKEWPFDKNEMVLSEIVAGERIFFSCQVPMLNTKNIKLRIVDMLRLNKMLPVIIILLIQLLWLGTVSAVDLDLHSYQTIEEFSEEISESTLSNDQAELYDELEYIQDIDPETGDYVFLDPRTGDMVLTTPYTDDFIEYLEY